MCYFSSSNVRIALDRDSLRLSPNLYKFKEPRNWFQGNDSARLHRLTDSISWNRFLGSLDVYKFRPRCSTIYMRYVYDPALINLYFVILQYHKCEDCDLMGTPYYWVENLSPAMGRGIDSRNWVWNWVAKLHRLHGGPVRQPYAYLVPSHRSGTKVPDTGVLHALCVWSCTY